MPYPPRLIQRIAPAFSEGTAASQKATLSELNTQPVHRLKHWQNGGPEQDTASN